MVWTEEQIADAKKKIDENSQTLVADENQSNDYYCGLERLLYCTDLSLYK